MESHMTHQAAVLDLIGLSARVLFQNGQTTERMVSASEVLAGTLGCRVTVFPRWGELVLRIQEGERSYYEIVAVEPWGVDMHKVAATTAAIEKFCAGSIETAQLRSALETIVQLPAVSLVRFSFFAAAGAMALAVIFGTTHLLSLVLIAFSAAGGACLRRLLAGMSRNLFVQPFCAALLAGVVGAVVVRLQLSPVLQLVAVCPCMVLVPGPHFLNGMIDLARARIPLGAARIAYAILITVMICAGLLLGLALFGVSLPVAGPSNPAPVAYDVVAAGAVVAAYCTFFAMPWRMLPIPILIGMLAHASRWVAISLAGADAVTGALVACLFAGVIMTPVADRVRLPFAGLAFASVVSLIPGVFLFRLADGMVELVALGSKAPQEIFDQVVANGTTAILIILAMSFGLIFPKLWLQNLMRPSVQPGGGGSA
ncbi:MAG: threonine/serine exporter family protein [Verrucomicrobia bacterium]|nr:threonine/serine exporter family protein [Verrucomicrobiota bacterium]